MKHTHSISILSERIRFLQEAVRKEEAIGEYEMNSDLIFSQNTIDNCKHEMEAIQNSIKVLIKSEENE